MQAADLAGPLSDADGAVTVLAPTNAAFEKIPMEDLNALLADTPALVQVFTPPPPSLRSSFLARNSDCMWFHAWHVSMHVTAESALTESVVLNNGA